MRRLIPAATAALLAVPATAQVPGLSGDLSTSFVHGAHTNAAGDVSARNIYATGGTLAGVDVSQALVNGRSLSAQLSTALASVAGSVTQSQAGQPNGWLQLDANAVAPITSLPTSVQNAPAQAATAIATATAAQNTAAAAIPSSTLGKANGPAQLTGAGLLPTSVIDPTSAATDSTARNAATAAQTAASAAQSTASAAIPTATLGKPSGPAQLTSAGLLPTSAIDPTSSATDQTARTAAASAQSAAAAAQTAASAAIPNSALGKPSGPAQLTSGGLLPPSVIDPTSAATDQTARSEAQAAQSAASSAQTTASGAIPTATLGQANGPAKLSAGGLLPPSVIDPASIATDTTARNAASAAQTAATAAQSTASAAIPTSTLGKANGPAQLDSASQVPPSAIDPTSIATDTTARNAASAAQSAATAAQTTASAAVPQSTVGKASGIASLDTNGLVPTGQINPASAATDSTARSAAATAQSAATAAQTTASAAIPTSQLGQANGPAKLTAGGLLPPSVIDPSSIATDTTARNAASAAQSAATAAQTTASAAVPRSTVGNASGIASLDASGLVPTGQINPASSATDSTARSAAATAQSAATAAQTTASAAIPTSQLGQANGPAKLTAGGLLPPSVIDPASIATDTTARNAASAAQFSATAAQSTASAAIPSSTLGKAGGPAQLDTNGTISGVARVPSWSGAVPRSLAQVAGDDLNVKDFKCTQINWVCASVDPDDTASFQRAITLATSQNLGFRIYVPSGTYIISSPLVATITGNAGLDFDGAGSGEVMLITKYPATATDWDLFDINLGNGGPNGPYREPGQPGLAGQFLKINGFSAIQDDTVGHPAGDIIKITGNQNSSSSILPNIMLSDIFGLGGAAEGASSGADSGYDAWLNGVEFTGSINTATLTNWGVEGPLNDSCSATQVELGEQYVPSVTYNSTTVSPLGHCKVAGAGVLLNAPDGYNQTVGGVTIKNGNVKGYMAGVAVSGQVQGTSVANVNTFNDGYGLMIGGGQIIDQLGGPAVVAQASGTSTYGATAATQTITLAAANAGIVPGMRVEGTFMPFLGIVQSVSGTSVVIATANNQNFGIGGNFTNENVSFTNGKILTSPPGAGTFGISFACDDWYGCVSAPSDPSTFQAMGNIVINGVNIISGDGSPNWVGFSLGHSNRNQVFDNDWQSSGGMNQQFLVANTSLANPSIDVTNNILSASNSTAPQISLQSYGQAVVSGNHLLGTAPLGNDTTCGGAWGVNFVNSVPQIGVSGCPGLSFDANQNLSVPGFVAGAFAGGGTSIAGTGTAQTGATQLTAQTDIIACSSGATAYLVPATAEVGDSVDLYNAGSTACLIYPQPGAQLAYDLAPNVAFSLPAGAYQRFTLQTPNIWFRPQRGLLSGSVSTASQTTAGPECQYSGALTGHETCKRALGYYGSGTFPLTLDSTGAASSITGSLFPAANQSASGGLSVTGMATCQAGSTYQVFQYAGFWTVSGTGALTFVSMVANPVNPSTAVAGWGMTGAVDGSGHVPEIQMTGITPTADCTTLASETVVQ